MTEAVTAVGAEKIQHIFTEVPMRGAPSVQEAAVDRHRGLRRQHIAAADGARLDPEPRAALTALRGGTSPTGPSFRR